MMSDVCKSMLSVAMSLGVCVAATSATSDNKSNYFLSMPSSLGQYQTVFLDLSYEQFFMATCEYDEHCIIRHPYVAIQDKDEREAIAKEWVDTKTIALSRLEHDCKIVGCTAFRHGRLFDRFEGWSSWEPEDRSRCLQIYLHVADDEEEFSFLINRVENLIVPDPLPSISLCDAYGILIVCRNYADQIRFLGMFNDD